MKKLDGHPDDVYSVAWSPDGKRLASIGYGGNLYVWDAEAGKPLFHQKIAPAPGLWRRLESRRQADRGGGSDNKGYILEVP